jgi:hypothetical protein
MYNASKTFNSKIEQIFITFRFAGKSKRLKHNAFAEVFSDIYGNFDFHAFKAIK